MERAANNSSERTPLTAVLAKFVCELEFENLQQNAVHEVKRALLDFLGVSLLGADHKVVNVLLAYLAEMRGAQTKLASEGATVIGRAERLDPVAAAWVNGTMGHEYDFDDVHSAAGIHPGIVIVPGSLAAAEMVGASGRKLIAAMAAGYEVAGRVGTATQLTHYEPGWHSTGTIGTLGAAAAAANVLGLDATQSILIAARLRARANRTRPSIRIPGRPIRRSWRCHASPTIASATRLHNPFYA